MALPANNNLNGVLVSNIGLGDIASPSSPLLIQVDSTIGWPDRGVFSINEEIFYYDQDQGGNAVNFAVLYRAYDFSALQSHSSGTPFQQRIIAQHQEESLNQRQTKVVPGTGNGQTVMRIPGSLIVTEVELIVEECFDEDVEIQIVVATDTGALSPESNPPTSPCDPNVQVPQRVLMDFEESELLAQTRWSKAAFHSFGGWQDEHRIVVAWRGPTRTIGKAHIIIHTSPRSSQS